MKFIFYSFCLFSIGTIIAQREIPLLEKRELVEDYYEYNVSDPYRYVENLNDSTLNDWIKKNNEHTNRYFANIESTENIINNILDPYVSSENESSSPLITINDLYFYVKTNTKENISKLYYKNDKSGEEKLIFDPISYKNIEGVNYSINHFKPCHNGEMVAIGLTRADNEFSDVVVINVQTKKIVFETTKKSWPSALGGIKWDSNCSGIFYTYVPVTDKSKKDYLFNSKVIYIDLKNNKKEIEVFSKSNNPKINFKEEDFPLIYYDFYKNNNIITTVAGVGRYRDTYFSSLKSVLDEKKDWKLLFKASDKVRRFFLLEDDLIYLTAKNASNFKLCKTSINQPNIDKPEVLVPEYNDGIITSFTTTKDGIYFVKVKNGVDAQLMLVNNNGIIKEIELPSKAGNIILETKSPVSRDLWVTLQGWGSNSIRYYYNIEKKSFELEDLDLKSNKSKDMEIIVEEVLVESHDGEEIPLSLIYNHKFKRDESFPLFITAYGAYGRNIRPRSSTLLSNWIKLGGVYAVAHVRGGGEKGYSWHASGQKINKANSWKDLLSCVKYLHENNYSKPTKTVAWGASAGAITVGRAVLEEPDLFSACVITSGILNTVRSEFAPNGKNNIKEFGSVNNPKEFKALLDMDSFHNLQKNTNYPAFLVTTGYNDTRVAFWQSVKFIARLREYNTSKKPILLSIDFEAGHGRENSKRKTLTRIAKRIAFALSQTGHPDYQPE